MQKEKEPDMKKYFLNPLFAPIATILFLSIFAFIAITSISKGNTFFFEDGHFCDIATYTLYGAAVVTLFACMKDFKQNKLNFGIFLFLLIAAVFREMGIQHWLTSTDTTAFKMPFLMTPEKAAKKIIKGICKNKPIIAFPWPMVFSAWLMSALPACIAHPILRHLPKK